jgi:hypothetical protein
MSRQSWSRRLAGKLPVTASRQRLTSSCTAIDSDYYRYPIGTPEHYAAYAKEFEANYGIGYPVPGSPRASYEADFAYELAFDADQYGGPEEPEADWDVGEDDGPGPSPRP